MVLYLVSDDVLTVHTVPVPTISASHWDEVIVILSDEEYSSDDEKYDIPEDDIVPAVPWDDVSVISSDEEPEMPAKKVSVKSRKRVFALVDESDSDDDSAESPKKAVPTAELPESAAAYTELLMWL
nr:hypothetical protein [Tanacetum cinerariifolium]